MKVTILAVCLCASWLRAHINYKKRPPLPPQSPLEPELICEKERSKW